MIDWILELRESVKSHSWFLACISREMVDSMDEKQEGNILGETHHEFMILVCLDLTMFEVPLRFPGGDVS